MQLWVACRVNAEKYGVVSLCATAAPCMGKRSEELPHLCDSLASRRSQRRYQVSNQAARIVAIMSSLPDSSLLLQLWAVLPMASTSAYRHQGN
jgi:hypothetical protein